MKTILFFFICVNVHVLSQDELWNYPITDLQLDAFGNVFIQKENELIKINKSDNKLTKSSFSKYGKLTRVITKNPFRIILFFKDSQRVIFLDKNLNKLNIELNLQNIQNNIISDIESHSNFILLLSEKSNELCIYDFKKTRITNSNSNIQIQKKEYLRIFFENELIFLINNEKIQVFNNNLNLDFERKIKNCEKIFFTQNKFYLKITNELYQSKDLKKSDLIFMQNINSDNNLFWIKNNNFFTVKNQILLEQKLR